MSKFVTMLFAISVWSGGLGAYATELPQGWTFSVLDGGAYTCSQVGGELFSTFRLSLTNGASLAFSGTMQETPFAGDLPGGVWMHLDATREDSLQLVEQDGVRYVQQWNDVRGTGYPYAAAPTAKCRPILHEVGGRTCVDFGSLVWNDPVSAGGMTLNWSEANASIRSVFLVFSDLVGASAAQSVLCRASSSEPNSFVRGTGAPQNGGALLFNNKDAAPEVVDGSIWFDGVPVTEIPTVDPACFHQVGVVTTGPAASSAFARDGAMHGGGIRIAECIVYNRALEAGERLMVEAYLANKWFGRSIAGCAVPMAAPFAFLACEEGTDLDCGSGLRAEEVEAAGTVTVSGNVFQTTALTAPAVSFSGAKLAVKGLVDDHVSLPEPWAHWDASRMDSLDIEEVDGVKYITTWRPVSGTARERVRAEAQSPAQRPVLSVGAGVLLPFVDFGLFSTGGSGGRTMIWNIAVDTVRSVVVVVADQDNENRCGFLGTAWMTPTTTSYCRNSNGGIINPNVSHAVGAGRLNVNGRAAKPTTPFPGGFNIFSSVATENVKLNCFARDENWWTGGLRIAELYVFEDALTDAQMHYLENRLSLKWFGHALDCVTASAAEPEGPASGSWLHLDAADTNSFTLCGNEVIEWRDHNLGDVLAYVPAFATAPTLVTEGTFNYVDMGTLSFGRLGDGSPTGCHLLLNATNTNVYTVFLVHSDVPGSECQNVVGNARMMEAPSFARGQQGILLNDRSSSGVAPTALHGSAFVDGAEVQSSEYVLPAGFHVICFEKQRVAGTVNDPIRVDAFGCDYRQKYGSHAGGQRLAEAIVYDRRLNPSERNRTTAYLLAKYRRESRARASQVGTLTLSAEQTEVEVGADRALTVERLVASGEVVKSGEGPLVIGSAVVSALRLEGGWVQAESGLSLNALGIVGGTVRGNVVLAQNAQVNVAVAEDVQGCVEIAGRLTLAESANLRVEASPKPNDLKTLVPFIRCADVVGSCDWTASIEDDNTCRVRVVATAEGLSLQYVPVGLTFLIR